MDSDQNSPNTNVTTKKPTIKIILSIIIIVFVFLGGVLLWSVLKPEPEAPQQTNTTQTTPQANGSAIMLITSTTKQLAVGKETDLKIYVDSGDAEVNAVNVTASYPKDIFEIVDINYEGSAFTVQAEENIKNGTIVLQRGALKNTMGESLVATVKLKALKAADSASLTIKDASKVLQPPNSNDILNDKQGVAIKVVEE